MREIKANKTTKGGLFMRDIRFRAWDKENKVMVYDTYPQGLSSSDILARWNPEWIMQYTGLKDKNGKEIYEGDIVEFVALLNANKLSRSVVRWNLGGFIANGTMQNHMNLEVIGNIYENPELLKGEEQ